MTSLTSQRRVDDMHDSDAFSTIIAESEGMRQALAMARRVATTPLRTLLLNGEAGTGKELLARCIHNEGLHANAPFVSINCSSIPAPLLEIELFGRGPSRHDHGRRLGVLELAGRGTVFLEDVGDLPPILQLRLCQAIEQYSVPRLDIRNVASGDVVPVHCRVIAASKVRLDDRVATGLFRDDLLARLSVLRIELPPLRERDGDARIIANHMLAEGCRLHNVPPKRIGLDAAVALREHRWPGNVRELKHVMDRALSLSTGPLVAAEHLAINQRRVGASAGRGTGAFGEIRVPADGKRLRDIEREALDLTLRLTQYNQSAAARILCISRPTLARKLKAYGLVKGEQR